MHGRKIRLHAGKLRVEIASVRLALHARHERRRDALMINIVPIDVPEESVRHDFLGVSGAAAKAQLRFAGEELLQDRDAVARHVDRVQGLVGENGVVDLVFVFAAEGRLLEEHLVDEDAKGPPVDCAAVLLVEEDLEMLVLRLRQMWKDILLEP